MSRNNACALRFHCQDWRRQNSTPCSKSPGTVSRWFHVQLFRGRLLAWMLAVVFSHSHLAPILKEYSHILFDIERNAFLIFSEKNSFLPSQQIVRKRQILLSMCEGTDFCVWFFVKVLILPPPPSWISARHWRTMSYVKTLPIVGSAEKCGFSWCSTLHRSYLKLEKPLCLFHSVNRRTSPRNLQWRTGFRSSPFPLLLMS